MTMFNPWINVNPNQPFPFWEGLPASQPNFIPPVFAQLQQFGSMMQSMQKAFNDQASGAKNVQQMEELMRTLSALPLMAGLPSGTMSQQIPWANLPNTAGTSPMWNFQAGNAPALGITREYQEDWTKLTALQQECHAALVAFSELFQDFARRASESFVATTATGEETLDFDAMCREWIECSENAFQEVASSEEFASRLGRLVNTNLKLMQHSARMQEKAAELQGQPTRGELDDLQRRNLEAQRRIETLEERIRQLELSRAPKRKSTPKPRRTTKKSNS